MNALMTVLWRVTVIFCTKNSNNQNYNRLTIAIVSIERFVASALMMILYRMTGVQSDILERQNISGGFHTLLFSWVSIVCIVANVRHCKCPTKKHQRFESSSIHYIKLEIYEEGR